MQAVFKLQAVEYAILFFLISYLPLFQRGFCQKSYEKTIIFSFKFPKFISQCSILQNIRMSKLLILKWRPVEYKANFEKRSLLFSSEIAIFDIFFKRWTKKVLKIYKSLVIQNFKPVSVCPIKWWLFKVFAKLRKSALLIQLKAQSQV